MATTIVYSDAVKTARMTQVLNAIDAGAGAGYMTICQGATVLATIPFADPCGSVTGGVLTFDCTPALQDAAADSGGVADNAKLYASTGGTPVATGITVSATGGSGMVQLDSTTIGVGTPVTITAASITHG